MNATRPFLSVIVPAKDAAHQLVTTLRALDESDLPRTLWELIVVDDVSSDDTAVVASAHADLVIRLTGKPHGPAYARNRAVERARGECVAFFDADVQVRADTLSRIVRVFATRPEVAAVFGSYDDAPAAPGLVSQYRNLLHHYTHHQSPGEAHTFWAGAGAVRRDLFVAAGMYDEWRFPRPQVEDIELGHRIRALGGMIVLDPGIQVKHLKRWTLWKMIVTDFKDRGVPWTRLLVEGGMLVSLKEEQARVLSLRTREKVNTVLVWLALVAALAAPWALQPSLLVVSAVILLAPVLWFSRGLYAFFERQRGFLFALGVVPLHLAYYLVNGVSVGWGMMLAQLVGEPHPDPTVAAFAEMGVQTWPPVPHNPKRPQNAVVIPGE